MVHHLRNTWYSELPSCVGENVWDQYTLESIYKLTFSCTVNLNTEYVQLRLNSLVLKYVHWQGNVNLICVVLVIITRIFRLQWHARVVWHFPIKTANIRYDFMWLNQWGVGLDPVTCANQTHIPRSLFGRETVKQHDDKKNLGDPLDAISMFMEIVSIWTCAWKLAYIY